MRVTFFASTAARAEAASSVNPTMAGIFSEDQDDRRSAPNIDWTIVGPRDEARRAATQKLLDDGALKTAEDFKEAAFVFQHGRRPEDYLLAHTLAMVAAAKGDQSALWIATASLDRYLWAIKQPQVFGTQYALPHAPGSKWTQAPYDHSVVSDALRRELGVRTEAEQQKQLADMEAARTRTAK